MIKQDVDFLNNSSPKISNGKPYIICAAVWFHDGVKYSHQPNNVFEGIVITGRRHHNCFFSKCPDGNFKSIKGVENTQGFLTSDNLFLDRKEAGKLAFEVGQIERFTDCLFSEDLY